MHRNLATLRSLLSVFALLGALTVGTVTAQTTQFTYQGQLNDNGSPATGTYDLQFKLFDAASGGAQQGATVNADDITVTNGVFKATLDFGVNAFPGANRWLEISVRTGASTGAYTLLTPRSALTSAPYAIRSLSAATADAATAATTATTATNATQLGGVAANQYVQTNDARLSDARPPTTGSASYIQNSTAQQSSTSFNISGNGTVGGMLSGDTVNATTQYNLGGSRLLFASANLNTVSVGVAAGIAGSGNSFFGALSGLADGSGGGNSFFGYYSGGSNSSGSGNSFFGSAAGQRNFSGSGNSFFGSLTGGFLGQGSDNSFFGHGAGGNAGITNDLHKRNVMLGSAANFRTTPATSSNAAGGDENTFVGYQAGGAATRRNATAIGANTFVGCDDCMVLGNSAVSAYKVGIGTDTPADKLHVVGNGIFTGNLGLGTTTPNFPLSFPSTTGPKIALWGTTSNNHYGFGVQGSLLQIYAGASGDDVAIGYGGSAAFTETMRVKGNGNVGIGTNAPADKLHVNGEVRVANCVRNSAATQIAGTCSSDLRLKRAITPFPALLDKLVRLQPVNFYWRAAEFPQRHFGTTQSYGLIAQEVEAVFPDLVSTDEQGYKAVNYSKLPLLLLQAAKEQHQFSQRLNAENAGLKEQNAVLATRLAALEEALQKLLEQTGMATAPNNNLTNQQRRSSASCRACAASTVEQ